MGAHFGVEGSIWKSEFDDQIVFMRKIIEGGADKSYGIHVAGLAGIPQPVIHRSREILNEQNNSNTRPYKK